MRQVNTNEILTLHRRSLGWKYALVGLLTIALGASIFWIGPEPGDWVIIVSAILCILMGLGCLAAVVITHRRAGEPMLTLSADGVTFEMMGAGLVPWSDVTDLGWFVSHRQRALTLKITDAAHSRIVQSRAMRGLAKLDKAFLGSKTLSIWQTQIETPLDEVAQLIADYSIAHGGPNLRAAA